MAALVAAIHDCPPKRQRCGVDARVKRGHDGLRQDRTAPRPGCAKTGHAPRS